MDALAVQSSELIELRAMVDRALADCLTAKQSPPIRLHAAMRHAVLGPGKRIRPILTLLSARQLGCDLARALPAACALEMVHAASLVLDDLPCMDNAVERRGLPSVHAGFGEDIAVLTGVALLNEAFAVITRATDLSEGTRVAMIAVLAATVGPQGLIGGQEKDLHGSDDPSLAFLSDLHREKTGVLFGAAGEMGALAAGADEAARQSLRLCGLELGLAFQALDDLDDEIDLEEGRASVNLLSVLDRDSLRREADHRLGRAKAALETAPQLAAMSGYVDALLSRAA